jgi:hypothetical protein
MNITTARRRVSEQPHKFSLFVNWGMLPAQPGRDLGIEEVEFDTQAELRAFLTGVRMTLGFDRFVSGKSVDELRQRLRANPAANDDLL